MSKEFIEEIQKKRQSAQKESADWLTIFMSKFYDDYFGTRAFNHWFYSQWMRTPFNFRRMPIGYFVKESDLKHFYSGDSFLRFSNFFVASESTDHSLLTLVFDLAYEGNCQMAAEMKTSLGLDVILKGGVKAFSGTYVVQVDAEHYCYSLLEKPHFDCDVRVLLNGYEFPFLNRFMWWLNLKIFHGKNLLPNTRNRWMKHKPVMPPYSFEVTHDPELIFQWPKPEGACYDPDESDCD